MSHPSIDQQITFLYTRDLQTTAQFYETVLGLSLVLDQGACRIYRITADAYLGVCERDNALRQPTDGSSNVIFTLVTPEVDAWYTHLETLGVVFEQKPVFDERYGIYHCFLRDPNGYLIEIQRFLDSDWFDTL
ncbi:MAG: VOC family protein [Anaerolineae bacterium]|nr:VOC family protein [Anaerolineae bacterium]